MNSPGNFICKVTIEYVQRKIHFERGGNQSPKFQFPQTIPKKKPFIGSTNLMLTMLKVTFLD